ncbi:MAG: DAK2 domain-containing protein [Lachnospiraceae bacterium]|nr:DAK2 domain-containing protein [Lachnospiraceae bacterium]
MNRQTIDSRLYRQMVASGAENLKRYAQEINDLNVFPIPDGDTGDNMLLTVSGGANADVSETLGRTARNVADGMLLSARGNSGVILSQFFDGIADSLLSNDRKEADAEEIADAMLTGVSHAYNAVLTPTEGTILTVAREASEYAHDKNSDSVEDFFLDFLYEANNSLTRTPDLLPTLKKAGVVDSGGAGLIKIVEGMLQALTGKEVEYAEPSSAKESKNQIDLNKFTEDSVLEFGYCTEVLVRLQNAKTDIANFDTTVVTDFLKTVGDSVVCFKNGSILKIHVHTMTPDKVLAFCRQYGEFLTVKIENMTLQHNSLDDSKEEQKERKKYAVVTVASGDGIREMFSELGADCVINGGQSMNPSAADFIDAFNEVNADTIFVLPNNGNIILTAKQAADLYKGSKVFVIPSKTLGEGHAALTMLDLNPEDPKAIADEMTDSMEGVVTAAVSTCSRDTSTDGFELYSGEFIGFSGDTILSADNDRVDTAKRLVDGMDFDSHEICILISGKDADEKETEEIRKYIGERHPMCEVYDVDGGQSIYHYVLILE